MVDAGVGARMSVAEALTNLVFSPITELKDVKCSANWMWPAKLPGEGAKLLKACRAMCDVLGRLGVAVDGGKDSLSMAARVADGENGIVKSPGTLVISAYAPCPDVNKVVTPDLRPDDQGGNTLIYVKFGSAEPKEPRLAGSALAEAFDSVTIPWLSDVTRQRAVADLDDTEVFAAAFRVTQQHIEDGLITAGHDVSDGGLVTCLLEMAFAGNCAIDVDVKLDELSNAQLSAAEAALGALFSEEPAVVLEVKDELVAVVLEAYNRRGLVATTLGRSLPVFGPGAELRVAVAGEQQLVKNNSLVRWRELWEETSYQLDLLQTAQPCVEQERQFLRRVHRSDWNLTFDCPSHRILKVLDDGEHFSSNRRVAVVREEGSNGDREMAAAFVHAGFEVWDVCLQDWFACSSVPPNLDQFCGVAFVGGFSYADVLGSAKGWASAIRYHNEVKKEFERFRRRSDTFSLGVCNGCQLMALLGWFFAVDDVQSSDEPVHLSSNDCGRYQSYFSTVRVEESRSILLRDMAGSTFGVWVSHGEGKFTFAGGEQQLDRLAAGRQVALRYETADGNGGCFPNNPNGSPAGIAGLCSPDGRHLGLMPHPERCFLRWQFPYWPNKSPNPRSNWPENKFLRHSTEHLYSPWMKLFDNAYKFVTTSG